MNATQILVERLTLYMVSGNTTAFLHTFDKCVPVVNALGIFVNAEFLQSGQLTTNVYFLVSELREQKIVFI